jgi:hypothetical protein
VKQWLKSGFKDFDPSIYTMLVSQVPFEAWAFGKPLVVAYDFPAYVTPVRVGGFQYATSSVLSLRAV